MKSRILISISAITLLAALAMRPGLAAQEQQDDHHCRHEPKLIEFDGPDAGTVNSTACAPSCGTQVFDNNDMGEIVGSYTDTNIVPHGFLRTRDGIIIPFDAPGAGLGFGLNEGTVAYSINSRGEITGQFQDPDYVFHGFVRFRDGSFDTFDAPGAGRGPGQGTLADSINREGTVAGYFLDENNVYRGFVRARDGTITQFEAPHAGKGKYQGTVVADGKGLNPEGQFRGGTPTGTMGFTATCALPTGLSPPSTHQALTSSLSLGASTRPERPRDTTVIRTSSITDSCAHRMAFSPRSKHRAPVKNPTRAQPLLTSIRWGRSRE